MCRTSRSHAVVVCCLAALASLTAPRPASAEADLAGASDRIDALVEAKCAEAGVKPNAIVSDGVFLRRAHLDIVGRIPSPEEARAFLESTEPDKRTRLVTALLDSPGRVSHDFNYWADLLRLKSRLPGNNGDAARHYVDWVRHAIEENQPYDEFVHELITARGFVGENGAVGFHLRDRGMPLDHLSTTVQLFLGTQMLCAQCHDHPFDEWTQMDYYKLAAFSYPMDVVRLPGELERKVRASLGDLPRDRRRNAARSLGSLTLPFRNAIVEETGRRLELPHDYQYGDAEPGDAVPPQTPFGDLVELGDDESRVDAYARWMTSPENPRFAKTIANRTWKRVMGVGLFEPVDDIDNATKPENPELLEYLTQLVVDLDFDLRRFREVLFNTRTYQREAEAHEIGSGEPFHFEGPRLRRLSAEQIWDSMVTLLREDPDATIELFGERETEEDPLVAAYHRLREQDAETLVTNGRRLDQLIGRGRKEIEEIRAMVDEAVALGKSRGGKAGAEAGRKAMERLNEATDRLFGEYARLAFLGDDPREVMRFNSPVTNGPRQLANRLMQAFPELRRENAARYARYGNGAGQQDNRRNERRARETIERIRREKGPEAARRFAARMQFERSMQRFVRASELPSPAPEGHFLGEFGQSDRDVIENASDSASVPQALALLNGEFFPQLKRPGSVLHRTVAAAETPEEKCRALYLAMLSREPTPREREIILEAFEEEGDGAAASVAWALLNSSQFLFIE